MKQYTFALWHTTENTRGAPKQLKSVEILLSAAHCKWPGAGRYKKRTFSMQEDSYELISSPCGGNFIISLCFSLKSDLCCLSETRQSQSDRALGVRADTG